MFWIVAVSYILTITLVGIVEHKSISVFWNEVLKNLFFYTTYITVPVGYCIWKAKGGRKNTLALWLGLCIVILIVFYPRGLLRLQAGVNVDSIWHYLSILLLLSWVLLSRLLRKYPQEMKFLAFNFSNIYRDILYGVIGGVLLSSHFIFAIATGKIRMFSLLPFSAIFFYLFFEIGIQALGEEIFYRGLIFNYLLNVKRVRFWSAACISSLIYVGHYLVIMSFTKDYVSTMASILYIFMFGIMYAALFKWRKSIVPSIAANVAFSMIYYATLK